MPLALPAVIAGLAAELLPCRWMTWWFPHLLPDRAEILPLKIWLDGKSRVSPEVNALIFLILMALSLFMGYHQLVLRDRY